MPSITCGQDNIQYVIYSRLVSRKYLIIQFYPESIYRIPTSEMLRYFMYQWQRHKIYALYLHWYKNEKTSSFSYHCIFNEWKLGFLFLFQISQCYQEKKVIIFQPFLYDLFTLKRFILATSADFQFVIISFLKTLPKSCLHWKLPARESICLYI